MDLVGGAVTLPVLLLPAGRSRDSVVLIGNFLLFVSCSYLLWNCKCFKEISENNLFDSEAHENNKRVGKTNKIHKFLPEFFDLKVGGSIQKRHPPNIGVFLFVISNYDQI